MGGGAGAGFGGGHAYGGGAGRVHAYGQSCGYEEDWMAKTKETLEKELRYRGIEPTVIKEVVDKIEEPSHTGPVWTAIFATAFILTVIFWIVWEIT